MTYTIHDIRNTLRKVQAPSRIARRKPITGATIHYNGPPLPFWPNPAREEQFVVSVMTPSHIQRLRADSLQYHYVVLSDGKILYTRSTDLIAWHCGNPIGNEQHLAINLPLGGTQKPTTVQYDALKWLLQQLQTTHRFPATAVVGHCDWPRSARQPAQPHHTYRVQPRQSVCPGAPVYSLLAEYRKTFELTPPTHPESSSTYRTKWRVPIRQAPRTVFLDGTPVPIVRWLPANALVAVQALKSDGDAEYIFGSQTWAHVQSAEGFIHLSGLEEVSREP